MFDYKEVIYNTPEFWAHEKGPEVKKLNNLIEQVAQEAGFELASELESQISCVSALDLEFGFRLGFRSGVKALFL